MSRNAAKRWSKVAPHKGKAIEPPPQELPQVEEREFKVEFEEHGYRLDEFLESRLNIRKNVARLKVLNGEVSVKGSAHARFVDLKPAGELHAGDVVVVIMLKRRKRTEELTKKEKKILEEQIEDEIQRLRSSVLYKDAHLLVINKPAGLAVQGGSKVTIHLDSLLEGLQFDAAEPPRLVHRLDKDTTGALLLARTKEAAVRLSALLKESEDCGVTKTYWALVSPALTGKEDLNEGKIDPFHRVVTGVVQVGKPGVEKMSVVEWHENDTTSSTEASIKKAVTDYRVLASRKHASLVELRPITGRKHQLRVHCAMSLQCPIVGDYKYGTGCPKSFQGIVPDPRHIPLHLHMRNIRLKDWYGPEADLQVTAPLPEHMERTLESLRLEVPY